MTEDGESKVVHAWCDGACSGNPGPGGWGAVLRWGDHERELSGGASHTTNNRMELTAAIHVFKAFKRPVHVVVHTDSQYVIKGITEWIHGWMKKNWVNSQKKPVENRDLWEELWEVSRRHKASWRWVRGHSGDVMNERVDALARAQSERHR